MSQTLRTFEITADNCFYASLGWRGRRAQLHAAFGSITDFVLAHKGMPAGNARFVLAPRWELDTEGVPFIERITFGAKDKGLRFHLRFSSPWFAGDLASDAGNIMQITKGLSRNYPEGRPFTLAVWRSLPRPLQIGSAMAELERALVEGKPHDNVAVMYEIRRTADDSTLSISGLSVGTTYGQRAEISFTGTEPDTVLVRLPAEKFVFTSKANYVTFGPPDTPETTSASCARYRLSDGNTNGRPVSENDLRMIQRLLLDAAKQCLGTIAEEEKLDDEAYHEHTNSEDQGTDEREEEEEKPTGIFNKAVGGHASSADISLAFGSEQRRANQATAPSNQSLFSYSLF
jgi:hypothetical protein